LVTGIGKKLGRDKLKDKRYLIPVGSEFINAIGVK
jgi:hypothetical protein